MAKKPEQKEDFVLTPDEKERRLRSLENAFASSVIEGMPFTEEEKVKTRRRSLKFETSDEMVAELMRERDQGYFAAVFREKKGGILCDFP